MKTICLLISWIRKSNQLLWRAMSWNLKKVKTNQNRLAVSKYGETNTRININVSILSKFCYLEPGLYLSITNTVETMNTLFQRRHNHSGNCITVEVSLGARKIEVDFAFEGSGFAFYNTDFGHFFGIKVGNEFGLMLRGKEPHKQKFAFNVVCILSLMITIDLFEYDFVGDTKALLLNCFFCFKAQG